ncbi:hypothetical protein BFG57_18025 [Bacillus solimangrovi]|uniref:Mutator family transposase n=1 Tax=Bacillus solimangrovi TaxID=1305675 RepID=A0A1E5LC97_9BACI|nr:hypothetical protein BFG57_18025 [Bacillus solimangrovi]
MIIPRTLASKKGILNTKINSKVKLLMFLSVNLEGSKDILEIWIGETESSKFWLTVLNDLTLKIECYKK